MSYLKSDGRSQSDQSVSNSRYTTANIDSTEKSFKASVERPVTAIQLVLDKLSGLAFGGGNSGGTNLAGVAKSADVKADYDDEFGKCPAMAKKLHYSIDKIRKQEQYLQKLKHDFQTGLQKWEGEVNDPGSKAVIKEACFMFETQVSLLNSVMEKDDEISKALVIVSDKEKAMKKLFDGRKKLKAQWRQTSSNFGDKSYIAQAIVEDIESNSANLQVSQAHFNKAVNTKLKEALYNYGRVLKMVGASYEGCGVGVEMRLTDPAKRVPQSRDVRPIEPYDHKYSENRDYDSTETTIIDPSGKNGLRRTVHCPKCSIDMGRAVGCQQENLHAKTDVTREVTRDGSRKYASITRIVPDIDEERIYHGSEWA